MNPPLTLSAQMLVIGTTLCGDWAAVPSILAETCPPLQGDNTWYVSIFDALASSRV